MFTITDEMRLFGPDSFMELTKYPLSTFPSSVRWLAQPYDEEKVAILKEQEFVYN